MGLIFAPLPAGELLKRPLDLIDPNSDLATLYSADDSRFPLSHSEYSTTETLFLLRQLGMATESISWEVKAPDSHLFVSTWQ